MELMSAVKTNNTVSNLPYSLHGVLIKAKNAISDHDELTCIHRGMLTKKSKNFSERTVKIQWKPW